MVAPRAAILLTGLLVLVVAVGATYLGGTVSRPRLERFASRQRLTITVDNGNQVIRYLATTRRWRVAGFIGGILGSQIGAPPGTIIYFNFITLFAGWFLGALVAEVRVAHLRYGPIRAASLQPRRPDRYIRRFAWWLVPAAALVAVATGAATAAADVLGRADPAWWSAGGWLVAALLVALAVRLIQHAVLRRPQPLAAADVIAADDAIRSRSLHVLSGGGMALTLFMVLNQVGAVGPVATGADAAISDLKVTGTFVVAVAGWLVATSIWPPPAGAGRRDIAAKPAASA
jgi:hypothetical protein